MANVPLDAARLRFHYLWITCLPAHGSLSAKLYDEENDKLLGTLLTNSYPGYGAPSAQLWHSGIQSFAYELVADPLKLQSAQLGTSDQGVYLDNIAFEQ